MILLILILTILLKALTDVFIFAYKKQRIGKIVREMPFILLIWYFTNYNYQSYEDRVHIIMCYLFLMAALFDTFYNVLALRPFFYKGNNSLWDDLMKKLNNFLYIVMKLAALGIAVYIYIVKLM